MGISFSLSEDKFDIIKTTEWKLWTEYLVKPSSSLDKQIYNVAYNVHIISICLGVTVYCVCMPTAKQIIQILVQNIT